VTLPQRIYNRMRHQGLGKEFPEFTVLRAGGPNAALVFQRASGQPLNKGVPGLFSYDGYHRGFQREVSRVAGQLADEQGWVLAVARELPKDPAAVVRGNETLLTTSAGSTSTTTRRCGTASSPTCGCCRWRA
jgi:type VI secretion system protein ImpL